MTPSPQPKPERFVMFQYSFTDMKCPVWRCPACEKLTLKRISFDMNGKHLDVPIHEHCLDQLALLYPDYFNIQED